MTSERTADADVDARDECAKLIDAKVTPLLINGSLPPMWPWWRRLVDAIWERHPQHHRLVAANEQFIEQRVLDLEELPAILGWDGSTTSLERLQAEHAALVARNQQLQEALESGARYAEGVMLREADPFLRDLHQENLDKIRAALASVRARTP